MFTDTDTKADTDDGALWRPAPADAQVSRTVRFRESVNARHGLGLRNYEELLNWSTANIADFWSDVWDETAVIGYKGAHVLDPAAKPADVPQWFKEARLNWAENMLRCRDPNKVALVELGASLARQPRTISSRQSTLSSAQQSSLILPTPHRLRGS
jgi:hypothetical protein